MSKFITVSLQFPHHDHKAVRFRLYETDQLGCYRVKRDEAWVHKQGVGVAQAMDLVAQELEQLLGLGVAVVPEPEPPVLRYGQVVTVRGRMDYEDCEEGPGLETTLYRVCSPVFRDAALGWCVFVMRPAGERVRKERVGQLLNACGKELVAPEQTEATRAESPDQVPGQHNLNEVRT